ncbi:hypothetical protein VTO73DRAFT_4846 [Trametes versicolor]
MASQEGPSGQDSARQRVALGLTELNSLIGLLPHSVPLGTADSPLATHFGDLSIDPDEGPYYSVDRAWVRVFQRSEEERLALITRGEHGVTAALRFFQFFASAPGIEAHNSLLLVAEKIDTLNKLVARRICAANPAIAEKVSKLVLPARTIAAPPPTQDSSAARPTTAKGPHLPIRPSGQVAEDDDAPKTYLDAVIDHIMFNGGKNKKGAKKANGAATASSSKPKLTVCPGIDLIYQDEGDDSDNDDVEILESDLNVSEITVKPGRRADKAEWAFSHYVPRPSSKKGTLLWRWDCNYCSTFRTSPRTSGCKDYAEETLARPPSSNFISHLEKCKTIPDEELYEAWKARRSGNDHGAATSTAIAVSNGVGSQREIMQDFARRGAENPEKQVTKKGWREHFVKAIIEDDLPFSLGEKHGMHSCLVYILPRDYTVPSRSIVRRDLDILYVTLDAKLNLIIETEQGKISISNDIWTSKGSVYAFAGIIGFWIDHDLNLCIYPLNLVPLQGDHSGAAVAKLLFRALKRRHIIKKLQASTSDNASNNGTMNRALSKMIHKAVGLRLKVSDIQIGCGAHVTHLVVQDILSALGLAPPPEQEDLYEEARRFPAAYDPEQDAEYQEEAAIAREELKAGASHATNVHGDSDSASEESASESDAEDDTGHGDAGDGNPLLPTSGCRTKKSLSCVNKLHAIVVDILRSEVRPTRMRRLSRQLCQPAYKGLVLIRGVPTRWNTTLAEIERALQLRPALKQWIEQLDSGLTGKKKTAALKKKKEWFLSPEDWELLETLVGVLKVTCFHHRTLCKLRADRPCLSTGVPRRNLIAVKGGRPHYPATPSPLQAPRDSIAKCTDSDSRNDRILRQALEQGALKLEKHLKLALRSRFTILGAVLHPALRVTYFENQNLWQPEIGARARTELSALYDEYALKVAAGNLQILARSGHSSGQSGAPQGTRAGKNQEAASKAGPMASAIQASGANDVQTSATEVELYLSHAYPCKDENGALKWWKDHEDQFPILALAARDVLAIPGVSVVNERLFSSSRHTISDARCSMTPESASKTVIGKEWLKRGLSDGVNYLDGPYFTGC